MGTTNESKPIRVKENRNETIGLYLISVFPFQTFELRFPNSDVDFLTDWNLSAQLDAVDDYDRERPSSSAIRFTLRLDEWLGDVDTFKFQILVSSGGGVDFVTNEPGNETGFNIDWLDPYVIELPSSLIKGFEYSEDLNGIENSADTSQSAADLIWWRVYVR